MKVKIVAIAKDEGAYIAEWIFHHLYFGFDAIDIYINRTTDNTCEILDLISKSNTNVNYFHVNWLDIIDVNSASNMQNIIYSQAYADEKIKDEYTHILFIDIDEFWTPLNYKSSIHECVSTLPPHDSISFQWFNLLGEKEEFNYLSQSLNGFYNAGLKSLISLNADIEKMLIQLPIFDKNKNSKGSFLSDGSELIAQKKHVQSIQDEKMNITRPYIILHKMFRSEMEYLSCLYRGNPEGN